VMVVVTVAILTIIAGMLLPSLAKAKGRAMRISALSNLKQIGVAAMSYANGNGGSLPSSFDEMKNELGSERILQDRSSGERFVYVGAGKRAGDPNAVVAYSPVDVNGRLVCFADGRVEELSTARFAEALAKDAEAQTAMR